MSLCYAPLECECAFCDTSENGRDAEWRRHMLAQGKAKPPTINLVIETEPQVFADIDEWLKTPAHSLPKDLPNE